MAAPCCGVLSRSKAMGFAVIEHGFDPASQTARGFKDCLPNRLQDRQNGLRVDRINRHVPDRPAIFGNCFAPLARVLLASPFSAL